MRWQEEEEEEGLPQHLLSSLISTTPWNEQVQSLNHLTDLALAPSSQTLRQLRSLAPYFQSAINSPRSSLVRSVCDTISTLAETLRAPFVEAVGNTIIPDLLNRSAVTTAVIRESCVNAASSMFEYGVEGVHFATVRTLGEVVNDRRVAAPTRATAALFIGMILVDNCLSGVHFIIDVVSAAIIAGCSDPDKNVRATSRENWRRLDALDQTSAAKVLSKLPPQSVQQIERERDPYGESFRSDRIASIRAPRTASMPVRAISRVDFRPTRAEVEEQQTERKPRPFLRPPRRSVLPGAFAPPQPPSPDISPPKRSEIYPVRRVFSPMAVDTPAPVVTPVPARASVQPFAHARPNDSPTPASEPSPAQPSPTKLEKDCHQSPNDANTSPNEASEKSTVSSFSCSTESSSATSNSQNLLTDSTSQTTRSAVSCEAISEKSVSAVSLSPLSTGTSAKGDAFQKNAGSGAPRGTNEDSPAEGSPSLSHSEAYSAPSDPTSPEPRKGRLSFIMGANQTPRAFTPLLSISAAVERKEEMLTFTPMDICTPMRTEETDGPPTGVALKPVAMALQDKLDEVAESDHIEEEADSSASNGQNNELGGENQEASGEDNSSLHQEDPMKQQESGHSSPDRRNGSDFEDTQMNVNHLPESTKQSPTIQEPGETAEETSTKGAGMSPDMPSTPDSLEDELLQAVASLTNSAEKKKKLHLEEDLSDKTSWDTLVQDLEKTLGLRAPVTSDPLMPEQADDTESPAEKIDADVDLQVVKPGSGKENQLPGSSQIPSEKSKASADTKTSDRVEEQETKVEMTKAERQAALAKRPPRRSVNPGAIKPMIPPVEKKSLRPSLAPPLPPKKERRKPPVPTFSRKPSAPTSRDTGTNDSDARSPSTSQEPRATASKPPATARKPLPKTRKPPVTARKLPSNRPRASTAVMRPRPSVVPVPSVRRGSTTVVNQRQPSATSSSTAVPTQPRQVSKPVSGLPPKTEKPATRKQTPRQAAVIEAYRACVRARKGDWSVKWRQLKKLEEVIKALQGDTLPPRLCDDAAGMLGEYTQETHHRVQLAALDALFFLLLCTERPAQITALHRALDRRPDTLRRVITLLKDGREDVRLACGRVMQSFEVLFGPEVQVVLLIKAMSGTEGKVAEMGCIHMLKTFERAKHGDGFVWKSGVLESLVTLLGGLKQNRRVEVRQGASNVLNAVKECLPERAFEIVCKKVNVSL